MRTQLAQANESLISAQHYNELVTIHGTAMVFLVGVPILAGFANYLVPLMTWTGDQALDGTALRLFRAFFLEHLLILRRIDNPFE